MVSHYLSACSQVIQSATSIPESTPTPGGILESTAAAAPQTEPTHAEGGEVVGTQTPQPSPTTEAEDGKARIAFVKTQDRATGLRAAIELLGTNPVAGQKVFLKPNFNSADPSPGSTHPDTLRALVGMLGEMGAGEITVGDRSGMGDTRGVMDSIGVFHLAEELGFNTLVFDELAAEDWVHFDPPDNHWKQGFYLPRHCLETGALVQACCLKTHKFGGHFTMSLKNSVGMVAKKVPGVRHNFMNELHLSRHQRRMIAEINLAYTPALVVLDGVEAFISDGPAKGEKVVSEVVLAGTDRVAIDAVGVALLRYHGCKTKVADGLIFEQDQIARAVELGLGVSNPEEIELLTGDPESAAYAGEIMDLLLGG
jgi:uncharacterized protein (DUF362 family)